LTWDGKRNAGNVTSNAPPSAPAPVIVPAAPAPPPPAPAAAAPTPAARVQIVQPGPEALSWGFDPGSITVHVGDTVTWTNTGGLPHTVTADDGSFDSELLNSSQTWTHTFDTAGTFAYHCTPHPWMKATIVVQGSGS
jgi:amicyanin